MRHEIYLRNRYGVLLGYVGQLLAVIGILHLVVAAHSVLSHRSEFGRRISPCRSSTHCCGIIHMETLFPSRTPQFDHSGRVSDRCHRLDSGYPSL